MKQLIGLIVLVVVGIGSCYAGNKKSPQETKNFTLFTNVDLMSQHVWRGGPSGRLPTIEPMLELTRGKFTFGAWGAATFDGEYRELDLYAIYAHKGFSIGVFDYYCPPEKFWKYDYLDFSGIDTYHLFSVDVNYTISPRVPLKLTASTMMGGMDYDSQTGDLYYSTYLAASYTQRLKSFMLTGTIGGTTHKGIYADKAAVINTELMLKRNFKIKKMNLPVFAKAIYNPYKNDAHFLVGVSLNRSFKF